MTPHCKSLPACIVKRILVAALWAALTACNAFDLYAEKFTAIAIGNSSARVIATLGQPDSIAGVEWPLVKIEQLAWRSRFNGRVYTVITVLDRVAGKTIIQ